ncbi:MAG: hypothetical protein ABI927_03395 [Gaiellaceae bacterium]
MTPAPNGDGYLTLLSSLLAQCDSKSSEEDRESLRLAVYERRTWGPRRVRTPTSVAIGKQADEIVKLLEGAARVLRPRETQALDDLVAGREAAVDMGTPYQPIRLHRRGGSA